MKWTLDSVVCNETRPRVNSAKIWVTIWSLGNLAWSGGQKEGNLRGRLGDSRGSMGMSRGPQGVKANVLGVSWGQRWHLIGPLMICKAVQYRWAKGSQGVKGGIEGVQGVQGVALGDTFWKFIFFIESGLKMIQFKIQSKIFIQKNIHSIESRIFNRIIHS